MAEYKPQLPFSTPIRLLIPTYETIKGVPKKTFQTFENGELIFCNFKTYGGTEKVVNDLYSVEDTANIETWFRPDIKADCRIAISSNRVYEVIGEPENINERNQFCKFKVRRVKGGA